MFLFIIRTIIMACSFHAMTGSDCGSHPRFLKDGSAVVSLKSCSDDISNSHLEQLRVTPSITSEASLILSGVGIFQSSSYLHLTICPKHRRRLGIYWRSRAIRCQVPEEISGHKGTSKSIVLGDRGLGYFQSQKIMETIQVLVPVGSGIYHFANLMLTYYKSFYFQILLT